MSKRQNQSISGTISNLIDEGFDLVSSLKEITDNSIGALATNIRLFLDPINLTLYVIDNGQGMNKSGLTKLATLNDRKEISEAKQGKYGQGVKLALAYLTQLKGAITIISKSQNYDASKDDSYHPYKQLKDMEDINKLPPDSIVHFLFILDPVDLNNF